MEWIGYNKSFSAATDKSYVRLSFNYIIFYNITYGAGSSGKNFLKISKKFIVGKRRYIIDRFLFFNAAAKLRLRRGWKVFWKVSHVTCYIFKIISKIRPFFIRRAIYFLSCSCCLSCLRGGL